MAEEDLPPGVDERLVESQEWYRAHSGGWSVDAAQLFGMRVREAAERRARAEALREWRRNHPEAVARHNAARRKPPARLTCLECGRRFEGRRDRKWCSVQCKRRQYDRRRVRA